VPVFGTTETTLSGISGGNVVGNYSGSGSAGGFLYNASGYQLLDVPGSSYTVAYAVSSNYVIGDFVGSDGQQGYVYNISTGLYTTLDAPNGSGAYTYPIAVDGNVVVGDFEGGLLNNQGFIYIASAVPEPSSFILLGLPIIGLLVYLRRHRVAPIAA